jgi:arsenate reductase
MSKTKVLFLCTGNSCRSQMAEGFLRVYAGDKFEAHSAGTKPSVVNPMAIEVMRDLGIDISGQRSKSAADYVGTHFEYVITVCDNAKEQCPIFPGPCVREHWPFDDPADAVGSRDEKLAVFRRVRDEIAEKVKEFVRERVDERTQSLSG